MSRFKISLFSAHSLADTDYAEKVYEILDTWDFPPDVFDEYEPIRQPWKNREEFIATWRDESKLSFGQVLIRRKKCIRYYADVTFQYGPNKKVSNKPPYHGFGVYDVRESECRGENMSKLVELGDRLFAAMEMDYGFIRLDDEYDDKNIIKNVRHADGSLEPTHVIGLNWPYYIPGLYWINYYGSRYLERGFAKGIENAYPSHVIHIGGGIRVKTSEDPRFFESPDATETETGIRETLGANWFFDRERDADKFVSPDDHKWLDICLDSLRSPNNTAQL